MIVTKSDFTKYAHDIGVWQSLKELSCKSRADAERALSDDDDLQIEITSAKISN
jgi:hypothetical protein